VVYAAYKKGSVAVILQGEGLSVALNPFQGSLVLTEVPALLTDKLAPITPDLATLGFHTSQEGI
jgi:hypothetical protein